MRKIIEYKLNRAFLQFMRFHHHLEELLAYQAGNHILALECLKNRWLYDQRIYMLDVNNGKRP